jgi:tRNA dimethylallyltransferase
MMGSFMTRPVFILGQTASGKHEAAMAVADRLGGDLVSIDSMKVYRGMDIGTAKPRRPHRLMDICDPSESYNAGRFVRDARAALAEAVRPVFVGGTLLYYKALAYGLFEGPEADPALREELVAAGAPALHAELSRVDPVAAGKIHPHDLKRLVRAVEVFRKTGEPISSKHVHFGTRTLEGDVFAFRRDDLPERIARRTKKMLQAGLVEEVRSLLARPWGPEGRRAVGYREVVDFLEGRVDAAEMERLVNRNTHRLARHQRMWLQRLPEVVWVKDADDILRRLGA